ncbi:MAG: ABC transporter permease [Rhodospirillales bacterium]|jgi:ABC-2 type transport system permease protein|nr:ABC transporter permease [Rhodospirillales bacterium]MBT5075567.1 ABC transporter permease [Rhodospirillales bacterium]MBT5112460.1 ABC transporter permease [Rhodospirillales bacterium]MBT5673329.1 ABC transporter permease [Rhodospirillales bacterium]MBT6186846.1 ABC transporter permease [Rhodospirillales bacterium]
MNVVWVLFRRELASYFITPVAYVFIVIFLALLGALTFFMGGFFDRGQADLAPFFAFHTWLYLLLVPAISMRLWSEERKTGTIELLLTLPISATQAVLAKFFASWVFTAIALVLTFPIVITVNYLGSPDNGVIAAGYIGSLVMAGAYLAIGACFSAASKNQVIAFVLAVMVSILFTVSGTPLVLNFISGWAAPEVINVVAGLSFLANFDAISKGVLDMVNMVYFLSVIALFLFINVILVTLLKAR